MKKTFKKGVSWLLILLLISLCLQPVLAAEPEEGAYGIGNIAVGKAVETSSDLSQLDPPTLGYEGESAVDDNMGTAWIAKDARPQWITVDLGKVYRLDQTRWTSTNASHMVNYRYRIEASNDKSSWTMLADRSAEGVTTNDFCVDNVSGSYRYVRLTVTEILCDQDGTSHGTSVAEFQIYPTPPPPDEGEPAPLPTQHWELQTGDTQLTLAVYENKPTIFRLKNSAENAWNWTYLQSSVPLLSKVELGGTTYEDLSWQFTSSSVDETAGKKVTLVFTCANPSLELRSIWWARPQAGPVEHWMTIENKTGSTLTLYQQESLQLTVKGETDPTLWRFHKESAVADSVGLYKNDLQKNESYSAYTNTLNGSNTNGFIPLVFLDCEEEHGLYVGYEWPDGRINVQTTNEAPVGVVVSSGLSSGFKTDLAANAVFQVPSAYLGVYQGNPDVGSNTFKKWFKEYKMPSDMRDNPGEPLLQTDDQGLQKDYPLASWGIQALKWDYGWWPGETRNGWMRTNEGDWQLGNPAYISHINGFGVSTMPAYGDLLTSPVEAGGKGLQWTLYLLLHAAASSEHPFSVAQHPQWFSNTVITTEPSADLGNEECVAWLKQQITTLFNQNKITTYRSDFEPICATSDKLNRHVYPGVDTSYWCAVGFYDLIDYLRANVEGFRYECCGSGGSLKDFATLSHANVIQSNDNANYIDIRKTFYDSSYAIHPMQLQAPVNVDLFIGDPLDPDEAHYGWRSVIMGANNTASSVGDRQTALVPGTEETYLQHYAVLFRDKIRPLIRDANLYHILPRPDEVHWDGLEYFNPDTENDIKGAVFLFKPTGTEGPVKTVKLQGLDPNEYYRLEFEDRAEQNTVKTGAQLMEGLNVTISQTRGSEIIWIKEAYDALAVTALPTKTTYDIGEELDVSGGQIAIFDWQGQLQTLPMTAGMVTGGFESRKHGVKTVTISYQNRTATFEVSVMPPVLSSLNLALGKPATASSAQPATGPEKAVDGLLDLSDGFYCPAENQGLPQWLQVDLGATHPLSKIQWFSTNPECMMEYCYYLEGSNDSSSWTVLADHRQTGSITDGYLVDQVDGSYRYIRLTITGLNCPNHSGHLAAVGQLEVYGVPAES